MSQVESEKIGTGRPKANIDWKQVDEFLMSGCSGNEIAGYLGVDKQTIYDRCVSDNGIPFSLYSQQKMAKGDSLLKKVQFDKAISGDNTLLIWLGKTRLKQIDASHLAAAEATKINYTIITDEKGLASGIPAERLSNTNHQSPE